MTSPVRDAHTHFFSRVFFETLARQAPGAAAADQALGRLHNRAGIEVPDADPFALQLRWLEEMDRAGVESMVTFASVPEEAETVAEVCRTSAGRLVGCVVVNPVAPGAPALVERALAALGLRGVVLFPALHGYDPGDPACRPVLDRLREHRALCVVHCGVLRVAVRDLLDLPRQFDARFADPLLVVRPAGLYPDVPFVIPHFGGGLLREALLAGSWCENIHLDTSSSNSWMAAQVPALALAGVLERALAVFGPRRILFGTDSSTFPRGYRSDLLAAQKEALAGLGVAEPDRAAILGGNLERLLAP